MIRTAAVLCMVASAGVPGAASAQALPDTETGRYALSQTADGVVRLDTRSGAVSTCTAKDGAWSCFAAPDERAALDAEIGRLQAENDALRSQLAGRGQADGTARDPLMPALPKAADGSRKLEIPLPSDRDVEKAVTFLETAWRRLVEIAGRVQRDVSGKI